MATGAILLDIPFNGTAIDNGPSARPVTVKDGGYIAGRIDGAVYFDGAGRAEVGGNTAGVLPLSGQYTFSCWLRAEQTGIGPRESALLVKFAGADRYLNLNAYSSLTSWSYVVVAQYADQIALLVNGRETARKPFPTGWGKPTGWALINDNPSPGDGFIAIEQVKIYDGIVPAQFIPTAPPIDTPVVYSVNGMVFERFGVYVSASEGLLDNLTPKTPMRTEWDDYHGEVIDLTAPRYNAREITLSCFITAVGKDDFIDRLALFLDQFQRPGTQRLMAEVHSIKPLVYEVYLAEEINLKKQWSEGGMVGTFTLKLREPNPIKRVLKSIGPGQVFLHFSTRSLVTIFWGDGQVDRDIMGDTLTITHEYKTEGLYYIVVAGIIEDLADFSANCPIVWNKL